LAKPITYFHIGRKGKIPRNFIEVGRRIHLGKGVWMMRMISTRTYKLLKARLRA